MINKEQVTQYLKDIGIYNDIDEYMVDQFIYNLQIYEQAKSELLVTGSVLNISRDPERPYYQQSPAVSIMNQATKNILNISRKLALSPLDRANLKIDSILEDDGFDD